MFAAGAISGAVIILLATQFIDLVGTGSVIDWPKTLSAGADFAQVVALAVAGWWTYRLFVKQRVDRQRVDVNLRAEFPARDETTQLLRVVLEIKNVGNVEFEPQLAKVRIREIVRDRSLLPDPLTGAQLPDAASRRIERWPELAVATIELSADPLTLEPGETERYPLDFLLPATATLIQVHATVYEGGSEKGSYWDEAVLCAASPPNAANAIR